MMCRMEGWRETCRFFPVAIILPTMWCHVKEICQKKWCNNSLLVLLFSIFLDKQFNSVEVFNCMPILGTLEEVFTLGYFTFFSFFFTPELPQIGSQLRSGPQMPHGGFHLGPLIIIFCSFFFQNFGGLRVMSPPITFNSLLTELTNYS